ncbi:MAG: hypothetical protein ACREQN_14800 [Candidatus Binataceae bacterium]
MRVIKSAAAIAIVLLFVVALALPWESASVWAQGTSLSALIEPRGTPASVATLTAPVQPQGVPSLTVSKAAPTSTPTPAAQVFNCSCSGPGTGTHWMGRVQSSSFFDARQAAIGACLTYNLNKAPESPLIPPHQFVFGPLVAGLLQPSTSPPLPVSPQTNFSTSAQRQMCSICACN